MKKILTDCDGVLLDWETPFHDWMRAREYNQVRSDSYHIHIMYEHMARDEAKRLVKEFNNSAWMCCLPALRDAVDGVNRLASQGFAFDVITSVSLDPFAQKLRQQNLDEVFGKTPWNDLICLDTGADKDLALSEYNGTGYWWIEDKPENCDVGLKFGLCPILIDHPHNRWYNNPNVVRVKNWQEICELVLNEQSS